jgi:hypothetical protein
MRSVRSFIRLGKQRPPRDVSSEDEERALLQGRSALDGAATPVGEQASSRAGSQSSLESDNESLLDVNSINATRKRSDDIFLVEFAFKIFMVCENKKIQ